ncbi:kinesin-like nuclear fusion protein [Aspergillus wentii]|nr:kinesin-like nuclear fusion protein [Aspergillus wentii]
MENENLTQSRPATRSRLQAAGLKEMNSANTNSRSGLMQPGTIAGKSSGLPQPSRSKSVTQAPETRKTGTSTTSRSATGTTRVHTRANSTSTRSASTASRSGHFSSTVGYGARPPAAGTVPRSQSSLGTRKPAGQSITRPATSLDTHDEEPAGSVLGKRKGTHRENSGARISSQVTQPGPKGTLLKTDSREFALCNAMDQLMLDLPPKSVPDPELLTHTQDGPPKPPGSKIPTPSTPIRLLPAKSLSPTKTSPKRNPYPLPQFLTKDSAIKSFNYSTGAEWDQDTREKTMEEFFNAFVSRVSQAGQESFGLKETVELYKTRVSELEASRKEGTEANLLLRVELETMKSQLSKADDALKDAQRDHEIAMDDIDQKQRVETETMRQENKKQLEALKAQHQDEVREITRRFERELDDEKAMRHREVNQMTSQTALDTQRTRIELETKDREIATLQGDLQTLRNEMERERKSNLDLRQNLDTASTNSVTLESSIRALKARIEFLESGREEQSQAFEQINQRMMDAAAETEETKEKLRKEETLRRKLHNQVQELKGNIRVFCRVRPPLKEESVTSVAQIQYPDESEDSKEISIIGPEEKSSLGAVSRKNSNFSYDRVFGPSTQNAEVFEEISQLVQSALDGYNVCIFCYGQTGSGKTHTMSSLDGMIPRAVHQIYATAQQLEEKGWTYTMEGNFVEVYNENLNDLLGNADELDKKKHEIRHDMQRCKTIITDITTVRLESPEMVESLLKRAAANRSVAATKANERSSRSHSVFILKLIGQNSVTGERSEGTLNLVDLAGSERLSHSGATGERLKETQNINRSLSCLGDVISALGQGREGAHIPYRNSKLTYLLQFSLGGNSKTLMFVMVSPLQAHLAETLTSLKFATKVHNTHIGTAKRQARVRDS